LLYYYKKQQFLNSNKMDVKAIKEQLPTGAIKEIADLSGVHYGTVKGFFSGKKTKENLKLMQVTADFLEDYKTKQKQAIERLQAVASA
jgi:hypothetical protein